MLESSEPTVVFSGENATSGITAQIPQKGKQDQQRLSALEDANAVRLERAKLKKQMKAGEIDLDELLDEAPSCVAKMPIVKILTWVPQVGPRTAQRWVAILQLQSGDDTLYRLPTSAKYRLSAMVHEVHGS